MVRKVLLSVAFATCWFGLAGQEPVRMEAAGVDSLWHEPDIEYRLPEMPAARMQALPDGVLWDDFGDGLGGVRGNAFGDSFGSAFGDGIGDVPLRLRQEMPYGAVPKITAADLDPKIYNPYAGLDPAFYRSRNFVLMPIGKHYLNQIEGGDMAGVGGAFRLSDNITANVGVSVSSAYSGFLNPDRVLNASLNLGLDIRLADRVTLRMFGQYSAAPGLNPALNPMIGGANYFGGAVRVMITDNFGLEGGFTRSYFMGKWVNSYYVVPVIEGFGGIGISFGSDPLLFPVTQRQIMQRRGIPMK